ncbi:MAG: flagellar motor switch protein FliN [Acidothermus sp.]|nr:flagellar motor switch protein FliN [Acidothermus sp.]
MSETPLTTSDDTERSAAETMLSALVNGHQDPSRAHSSRLELLQNVEMGVTAELGRTRMTVRQLLSLTPGMVVELDRAAGSPIDLYVNGTLIARGEVVVIDEEFGVRISEIVGPESGGELS